MTDPEDLRKEYRGCLEELDKQDFINKGTWYNLPSGLTGELIERILYYRGQGAFFYMKTNDKFYFLPYSLAGDIDVYGRYKAITPVVFGGIDKDDKAWIPGLEFKVENDLFEIPLNKVDEYAVLLSDRSKGLSQTTVSRKVLNQGILEAMSEALPLARTSLIANSGVSGMRVNNEDDAANVKAASSAVYQAAMKGSPWIPIVGNIDFQDLTGGQGMNTQEYLEYFQALDNFRMKTHGFETGGVFEKKSQMLQDEANLNASKGSRVLDDTIKQRQDFCFNVNAIFGLNIWYEPNESTVQCDSNMDGQVSNDQTANNYSEEEGDYE